MSKKQIIPVEVRDKLIEALVDGLIIGTKSVCNAFANSLENIERERSKKSLHLLQCDASVNLEQIKGTIKESKKDNSKCGKKFDCSKK